MRRSKDIAMENKDKDQQKVLDFTELLNASNTVISLGLFKGQENGSVKHVPKCCTG